MAIRPNQNLFELLRTREILAILDGDATFEEFKLKDGSSMNIALPYLNGPDLCDLSTRFGLPVTYSWGGGTLSRWQYLDELIEHCIERNKCSDLLTYIFSKRQWNVFSVFCFQIFTKNIFSSLTSFR